VTVILQETAHPNTKIRVSAPARLHLGFLDLNGEAGRKFGSIGLAIDSHRTVIEVEAAEIFSIHSVANIPTSITTKIERIVDKFYRSLGQQIPKNKQGIKLSLLELIPEHAGLGSGTQFALTIGTLLCKWHNITASTPEIAYHLGRGSRSGIGIATFDQGGFIIDGGLSNSSKIPPLLAHHDFPPSWRIIMIMDQGSQGVHGSEEVNAFTDLPTFPLADSQAICHLSLMKLLPALVEKNIVPFGQAITDIQTLIGDHFAPAQGGRYTSPSVAKLLLHAQQLGHTGIAQSSWGPTGCIFVDGDDAAQQLIEKLGYYSHKEGIKNLSLIIAYANSNGANIEISSK